jgi:hypothetical protein
MWDHKKPELYPLPEYMLFLKNDCEAYKHASKGLSEEFDQAATCLWNNYRPLLDLMMQVYWQRPQMRNQYQHPPPTSISANSFVQSLGLTTPSLSAISMIINYGMKMEKGQWSFLFDDGDRQEEMGQDRLHRVLRSWLKKANSLEAGYVKVEKKRESWDDLGDRASKRAKHDTFPQ